jgi:hypothetical protein
MGVQAHQVGTIMTTGEREVVHQDDDPGSFIVSAKGRICAARSRQCFGSFVLRRDGMNSNSRPQILGAILAARVGYRPHDRASGPIASSIAAK